MSLLLIKVSNHQNIPKASQGGHPLKTKRLGRLEKGGALNPFAGEIE